MKNKIFREIGYWTSISAAILGLINIIFYLIKGIKLLNKEFEGDITRVFFYPMESFYSVMYKISLVILVISAFSMIISFLINTNGILKIIMVITVAIQTMCIGMAIIGILIQYIALVKLAAIFFSIMELVALTLYIIEKEHRKTIIRVIVFSLLTIGSGFIYMLFLFLLMLFLLIILWRLLYIIFKEPEHKTAIIDMNGKIIGWLKRE